MNSLTELDGRYSSTSSMSHRELLSYYGYSHPGWLGGGLARAISAGLLTLGSGHSLGSDDLAVLLGRGDRISRHHPELEAAVGVLVAELERESSLRAAEEVRQVREVAIDLRRALQEAIGVAKRLDEQQHFAGRIGGWHDLALRAERVLQVVTLGQGLLNAPLRLTTPEAEQKSQSRRKMMLVSDSPSHPTEAICVTGTRISIIQAARRMATRTGGCVSISQIVWQYHRASCEDGFGESPGVEGVDWAAGDRGEAEDLNEA